MTDGQTRHSLSKEDLLPWVEQVGGGKVVGARQAIGGNRCVGWALQLQQAEGPVRSLFLRFQIFEDAAGGPYNVRREAEAYAALMDSGVAIPRFVGLHPHYQAMLTECATGTAEYRALQDEALKGRLACQCMEALAKLHSVDAGGLDLPTFGAHKTIPEAIRAEIETWYSMYRASERDDPLIEFGRVWLEQHLPDAPGKVVLVHGDAGPGNFMFESGKITALLDWELAHLGDPMEDLAWYSLRSTLEPAPDFPQRIREYEAASGTRADLGRLRFYRALVSWRIIIIRHNNVSGRAGASVISRALNRRLFMEAIDAVSGVAAIPVAPMKGLPREHDGMYVQVLNDIRETVLPGCTNDVNAAQKAKDVAKAVKFMRELYNIGPEVDQWERRELGRLLHEEVDSLAAGRRALSERIRERRIDIAELPSFFRSSAAYETQLASGSMGALAARHFPPLLRESSMVTSAPFGPEDDAFHAQQMSDRWWETETAWFSFCIPQRRLGGWLYSSVRPNIGTVAGGAWVWDDRAHLPWDVLYSANYSAQRLRVGTDLRCCTLPNGVGIKVIEPLTSYELAYQDADRIKLALRFDAVMPPHAMRSKNSVFGNASHFDQFGRVTGSLTLLGETLAVDCLAMRDRSWGPRPEHKPKQSAYVTGIVDPGHAFLAVTDSDGESKTIAYGFLTRDGVTHDLVSGSRRTRRDPINGWATEVEVRAVDEAGRELHAVGRRLSGIIINRHTFIDSNGLIEWEIDGAPGYGEDQDLWTMHAWADWRRSLRK